MVSNTCLPILETLKCPIINNINAWYLRKYTQHTKLFDNSSITRKITRPCLFAFFGLILGYQLGCFMFLHICVCYLNKTNKFKEIAIKDMIRQSENGCMSSIDSVVCQMSERKTVLVWGSKANFLVFKLNYNIQ